MFNLVNKASLDQVRIVVEVARVEDGARGNASLGQLAHGLILITHQGPLANDPSQFVTVLVSICLLTKLRMLNEILSIDHATEGFPHLRGNRHHVYIIVRPATRTRV